ncbi:SPARC-related modular calcium-binding protein 1-like [Panonychus citri]|uniref:SPARC-related modular calcium-binding protein 1-like n=1 Tax=Panonychus citri TaxID=50023 RepID=UPI002307EF18|nr:SPARC-related modular calcium-binding protein 1-like [Panonychus citri]
MRLNQSTVILFIISFIQIFVSFGLSSSILIPSNCSISPSSSGCENDQGPVCSSEGKTYNSKCDLLVDQCKRSGITIVANYPCSTCLHERIANLAVKSESDHQSGKEILIPECDLSKGLYKAQQCHKETGYCWCVDINTGKPIWKTSAKGDKAATDCETLARKVNRRRRPRRDKKKCTKVEKGELISKLLEIFSEEYENQMKSKQDDVVTLLRYKFGTLDVDKDENINRQEFKDFRNSIKQRTKLNNCAASFFKVIDFNADKKISATEWISFYTNRREKTNQRSDGSSRSESRVAKASPSDIAMWSSNIASVHGLSLLNQKTAAENQAAKEKENEDELDHVAGSGGFNVSTLIFKPNGSETRQMMISRLKKMVEINKLLLGT